MSGMTLRHPWEEDSLVELGPFRRAARNGLGRAILWLRDHPWQPHAETLEDLCRHHPAYDPQCEGDRAGYVYQLLRLTGEADHFAGLTARALLEEGEDWDLVHRSSLARRFAAAGHAGAREAMHERFLQAKPTISSALGHELLRLDGIAGVLIALDRWGQQLAADPELWEDEYFLREARDQLGPEIDAAIDDAAKRNANIRAYLAAVQAWRQRKGKKSRAPQGDVPYAQLNAMLAADAPTLSRYGRGRWGRRASEADLLLAARDLLAERDPKVLVRRLELFAQRSFPLDHQPLVEMARSPDEAVATVALRALEHCQGIDVRELAVERLMAENAEGDAVRLLEQNYVEGDHHLIDSVLERAAGDEDAFHWLAHAATRVLRKNPAPAAAPVLLRLYERIRCSLCRLSAIEFLQQMDAAPAWLAIECRHDSLESIRELFESPSP